MLGVGPDGHIASLFPGSPTLDVDDRIAVGVTGSPKPPPERISLTFAAAATGPGAVWFLVSGEDKADGRRPGPRRRRPPRHPRRRRRGSEETIWFLDRASA